MKKNLIALLAILLVLPHASSAEQKAMMYFSGTGSSFTVGQSMQVSVMVNPNGQVFDTVKAVIKFPSDLLSVKSVSPSQEFSVTDPESFYNNTNGTISYAGGIPGGANKVVSFITIAFTAKGNGNAKISFDSQSIVLNGGDNVLQGFGSPLSFAIGQSPVLTPEQPAKEEPAKIAKKTELKPTEQKKEESSLSDNVGAAGLEEALVSIENSDGRGLINAMLPLILLLGAALVALFYFRKKLLFLWQGILARTKNNHKSNEIL